MRSPFAIFRTHQKVLMVILVGLSMVGFVLLGAVPDPTNMPRALALISVIAVFGGAAWILGMPSGRSKEYGGWGVVLGAALGLALMLGGGPPKAVRAESGDLTVEDLQNLRTRRQIANQFVYEVLRATRSGPEVNLLAQQYTFGFTDGGDRDIVTAELLRREARRLGLYVTDANVTEFIRKLSDNRITASDFRAIRSRLRVGEPELYAILADELQAQLAAEFLYGFDFDRPYRYSPELPPQQYWDFYRRMYVKQKAEIAAVPVKEFIDNSQEPTAEELAALFDKYRSNVPLVTPDNQFEEGRPGFMQPRRVQVGYLEAVFDDAKAHVTPASDADIEKWYQEKYVKPAEEAAARARSARQSPSGPGLPDQPAADSPQEGAPSSDGQQDAPPEEQQPASDTDRPATEPPGDQSQPEPGASDAQPSVDGPAEEPRESSSSALPARTESHAVALGGPPSASGGLFSIEETGPPNNETAEPQTETESQAETEPQSSESTGTPASEGPAETESTPTDETRPPVTETPPESAVQRGPGGAVPEIPTPSAPPLDEALREQIRIQIENQRTIERLRQITAEAANYLEEQVGFFVLAPEGDPQKMTPARAAELLKEYAAEHGLHYDETPLLSEQELRESQDHPLGNAQLAGEMTPRPLVEVLFQTGPQDVFRPVIAENPVTESWFVTWKISEQPPFEPSSLQDERIRAQVVQTWRELQAREKAEARARELADQVAASGQPMAAALAETTITGRTGDLFLTVTETPEFSWLTVPGAPEPNPFSFQPPQIQDPPGVQKAGPDFMRTVFDELAVGQTGVAANYDRSVYYVVRITERTPSETDPRYDAFRERFLMQPVFQENEFLAQFGIDPRSVYQRLAVREVLELQPDWIRGLWARHSATFVGREAG